MATSQAEVSRELRTTIREMVNQEKSNQEIYEHVQQEYGPDQIAVPHQGYLNRISYGLPYVAVGMMLLTVYWIGWNWWRSSRKKGKGTLSDKDREQLDDLTDKMDSPLK